MIAFLNSCQLSDHDITTQAQSPPQQEPKDAVGNDLIIVGWDGKSDPLNPANYSTPRKLSMTLLVSLIAVSVTAASAIDACGVKQYSEYFDVSEVVGSLATGKSK